VDELLLWLNATKYIFFVFFQFGASLLADDKLLGLAMILETAFALLKIDPAQEQCNYSGSKIELRMSTNHSLL